MFRTFAIAAATATLAVPAFADGHAASGDPAEGEKAFRQCVSCHVVQNEAGDTLAGRNARTGPNLYGIVGGKFGQVEDFRYSDINQLAADADTTITEEVFVAYVQDPTGYLRELTGDNGRSKMTYKVRKEEDAVNLFAYLASLQADSGS
ncbi:c-type cytochrome [Tateyamaria sp. ANG-S1]|uniref:c-type cytochrome n=1 Tax=Tateyamaria sp. ANG-S1 TaxID=1577905 RepID=UPI00057CBA55|nr:c-type cytochrome [Tateyamaria sp. ANG-S1]KIC47809.1 cytochrome C [Tateyamaria sp. ANG-S1]